VDNAWFVISKDRFPGRGIDGLLDMPAAALWARIQQADVQRMTGKEGFAARLSLVNPRDEPGMPLRVPTCTDRPRL